LGVLEKKTVRRDSRAKSNPDDAASDLLFSTARCIRSFRPIEVTTGERMPRYLSQHTLACLTRQGAEQLSKKFFGAPASAVATRRVLVNMQEGKMLVELEAPSREELEKWFDLEKFHYDWLLRLEWESAGDGTLHSI
jgi:hypothetical protein